MAGSVGVTILAAGIAHPIRRPESSMASAGSRILPCSGSSVRERLARQGRRRLPHRPNLAMLTVLHNNCAI